MRARDRSPFLDALRERVLVFDGAMGTSLQSEPLTGDDFGGARAGRMDGRPRHPRPTGRRARPSQLPRRRLRRHRDLHLSGHAPSPRGVGPGGCHHRPERVRRAARAEDRRRVRAGRPPALCGREHGADRIPARIERPGDEPARVRRPRARSIGAGRVAHRRRRRLLIIETQQDILETKAAVFAARAAPRQKPLVRLRS